MTESEIRWRLRRSILELDVLMSSFYAAAYADLTVDEREEFIQLLTLEDPELFSCIFSKKISSSLLNKLRSHRV